jgi:glycosyltransferase involved in cell wall biosynthesis
LRIAYLVNQYPAVSHSFIRREIRALEQLGFEVMRISIRGWDRPLADEEDRAERKRTRYVLRDLIVTLLFAVARMALVRPVRLLQAMRLTWRMSRISKRPFYVDCAYLVEACRIEPWLRTADIKHLHAHFGTNSAAVAMLVHELGGPPWSFTVHGSTEFDSVAFMNLNEKTRQSAFAVTVCSYGRSQLYRFVDYRYWPKIKIVHCGLEPAFYAGPDKEPQPQRLVCVGRLSAEKGQLLLVEAAARLLADNTEFELVLVGDGEMRAEIEALIGRHGLRNRVRITGWLSSAAVHDEIQAARALVLPSSNEGLPVVLMEAMALRRPVIATYVAGIPELVQPSQHGWLVPAGDVVALADAMQACLAAPADEIARMGEAARQRVLERHDVNTEARKLQKLFREAGGGLQDANSK